MLATFFLGPQPFGPPKMSLVLRPPVAWSLILRTGAVWAAYKGWKKERLSSSKYLIEQKLHNNVRFDSWALRYLPATATRFSEREELGPAFWGCRLRPAPVAFFIKNSKNFMMSTISEVMIVKPSILLLLGLGGCLLVHAGDIKIEINSN